MTEDNVEEIKVLEGDEIEAKGMPDVQQAEVAVIPHLSTQLSEGKTLTAWVENWDKLERMESWFKEDYLLVKWKLAMQISDQFESKKIFGQFLKSFKQTSPNHALCTINPSTFYRYACAARFCERFGIDTIKELGLSPTVIYSLSQKANESVIDHDFIASLKNKKFTVAKINQLICEAHSIPGELTQEPIPSTGEAQSGVLTQDFELEAIDNSPHALSDLTEKYEGSAKPILLLSQQPGVSCIESANPMVVFLVIYLYFILIFWRKSWLQYLFAYPMKFLIA